MPFLIFFFFFLLLLFPVGAVVDRVVMSCGPACNRTTPSSARDTCEPSCHKELLNAHEGGMKFHPRKIRSRIICSSWLGIVDCTRVAKSRRKGIKAS